MHEQEYYNQKLYNWFVDSMNSTYKQKQMLDILETQLLLHAEWMALQNADPRGSFFKKRKIERKMYKNARRKVQDMDEQLVESYLRTISESVQSAFHNAAPHFTQAQISTIEGKISAAGSGSLSDRVCSWITCVITIMAFISSLLPNPQIDDIINQQTALIAQQESLQMAVVELSEAVTALEAILESNAAEESSTNHHPRIHHHK